MRDAKLIFSNEQAFTAAETAVSTNVVDLTSAIADVGTGTPVYLNVECHTEVASAGNATIAIALEDSADDDTFVAVYSTPALAKTVFTAGTQIIRMPLPKGLKRYIRVSYTVGTAVLTAGKFNAYLDL